MSTRRAFLPLLLVAVGLVAACGNKDTKLKVTGLDPVEGDLMGGTNVIVSGNRFLDDGPRNVKIFFGNRQGTVSRFLDDATMVVQAPGGKPDETVDVVILFEPGGKIRLEKAFTYRDKSAAPASVDGLDTGKVKK